jgi:hypothetical protein
LYAIEANVVAARRLWPRSLAPPPLTHEDEVALSMYAKSQERRPEQDIESHLSPAEPAQEAQPDRPAQENQPDRPAQEAEQAQEAEPTRPS